MATKRKECWWTYALTLENSKIREKVARSRPKTGRKKSLHQNVNKMQSIYSIRFAVEIRLGIRQNFIAQIPTQYPTHQPLRC